MPASPIIANLATLVVGTFVFVLVCAFVLFAVLRVVTGISIQRPGYLSFKRISFAPKPGFKLEVRKLGLVLHRPTFGQPSWVTIIVQDSHITVDLRSKVAEEDGDVKGEKSVAGQGNGTPAQAEEIDGGADDASDDRKDKLLKLMEKLTKVLKWLQWISLVDVAITNTAVTIADVGSIQIGSLTLMVDTKRGAANRNPMSNHCTDLSEGVQPMEWMLGTKSVLLLTAKGEPVELLDHSSINVYGVVEEGLDGVDIRDLAIAFKLGRVTLPVDGILGFTERLKVVKADIMKNAPTPNVTKKRPGVVMEENVSPGSRTQRVTDAVMGNRELLHSIMEGVKEIQFSIGHLVISKDIPNIQPAGRPLQVSLGLKELWMDVHQLDRRSPAHQMYDFTECHNCFC
jgi:hypothetical protein